MGIDRLTRKWQKITKSSIVLFMLVILVSICMNSSCTGIDKSQQTKVASLDIEIRKIQSAESITSLSFWLIPRDDNGFLARIDGAIDAKLYRVLYQGSSKEEIRLIQEWEDIIVTSEDFTSFGTEILLDYGERYSDPGILEVEFTISDEESLISEVRDIDLENNYLC